MPPFLIAAAVAALVWYIKGSQTLTLPRALFAAGSPAAPAGPLPPATTSNPAGVTSMAGPVTNQPGTSASGVPSQSQQVRPYANTSPGFTISPSLSRNNPFFGYGNRNLFIPRQMQRMSSEAVPSSNNCGCQSKPSCGGCAHADGRGSCISSVSSINKPPTTNVGYIGNLASVPEANMFQVFQSLQGDIDTINGGVPAGPTFST